MVVVVVGGGGAVVVGGGTVVVGAGTVVVVVGVALPCACLIPMMIRRVVPRWVPSCARYRATWASAAIPRRTWRLTFALAAGVFAPPARHLRDERCRLVKAFFHVFWPAGGRAAFFAFLAACASALHFVRVRGCLLEEMAARVRLTRAARLAVAHWLRLGPLACVVGEVVEAVPVVIDQTGWISIQPWSSSST